MKEVEALVEGHGGHVGGGGCCGGRGAPGGGRGGAQGHTQFVRGQLVGVREEDDRAAGHRGGDDRHGEIPCGFFWRGLGVFVGGGHCAGHAVSELQVRGRVAAVYFRFVSGQSRGELGVSLARRVVLERSAQFPHRPLNIRMEL